MSSVYKVLGQSAPGSETNINVYAVPSSKQAVVSTIVIANREETEGTFQLAVRPAGAAISNQHYLAFDVPIDGNDSTTLTLGITMAETDVLTFQASTAAMSVNVFGTELEA